MDIELRPHQLLFEAEIAAAFLQYRTVIGCAATGFGKGVVFADLAAKCVAKGNSMLGVTNRRVVVKQLIKHCQSIGVHAGVIMGSEEADSTAPVQIASIQTLQTRKFAGINEPRFIIVDECHQFYGAYKELLTKRFPNTRALGLTATPVGPDGVQIGHFQTICEPVKNSEVIAAGDLLRVDPYIAPLEPDLGDLDLRTAKKELVANRVDACTVYGDMFEIWKPYNHLQTLVVLQSRAIANRVERMFLDSGFSAAVVDGTTDQEDRDRLFDDFTTRGRLQVILGVDVVREGLDLPVAQCLIDIQPTWQFRVFWQKLGRVKRPSDGQSSAVVIDLAGNLWRHLVHPDQDPPWHEITKDFSIEDAIQKRAGVRCPECGSKDIYGPIDGHYRCEQCKASFRTSKPWVCPHCRQAKAPWQSVVDGKCPNCGSKVGSKPMKTVRFEDGTVRTVSCDEVRRRKKKNEHRAQSQWFSILYRCVGANNKIASGAMKRKSYFTFRNAVAWYEKEYGTPVPKGVWPPVPSGSALDMPPERVHPQLNKRR